MPAIFAILTHTPRWAFVLCLILVALGVQALRPRTMSLQRLLLVPGVFITWGVVSLAGRAAASPPLLAGWLLAAGLGLALGWRAARLQGWSINPATRRIAVPGSAVPLLRNLAIFMAKYGLAVAFTLAPAWRGQIALWGIAVSGLTAGFFAGWLVRLALACRAVPRSVAAIEPAPGG